MIGTVVHFGFRLPLQLRGSSGISPRFPSTEIANKIPFYGF
jgi:hypothetical protein